MFKKDVYTYRRNALRGNIKSGLVVILGNSEAPMNYPANGFHFMQDSTFTYFFGLDHPDYVGILDIDADTDCIYGNDPSVDDIIWTGHLPTLKDMALEVGINSTGSLPHLFNIIELAIKQGRRIHFLPPYRAEHTLLLEKLLGISSQNINNYISTELIRTVVALREIKSSEEIEEIHKACDIGYLMHTKAMEMCHSGRYEREIAGAIEGIALSKGKGVSFHNIVTQNGETLHNHYHGNKLEKGRLMLVDAGAWAVSGYCSDFSRTMPVDGKFSAVQKEVYNIMVASFEKAMELIKPGVFYKDVHLASCKVITEGLTAMGLMKGNADEAVAAGAHALFMPCGLGHQMGMDVHDMEGLGETYVGYDNEIERSAQFGLSNLRMGKRLRKGHVITVEPGIYFIPALLDKWEKEGINRSFINYDKVRAMLNFGGCRVEDDVLVTENGKQILGSKRIPYTTDQVEDYMAKFL
ncbi:MAG: aminopeptidase P family protein [Rikenellaceae bacterium]